MALYLIKGLSFLDVTATSSVYCTEPQGIFCSKEKPSWFLNQVIQVRCSSKLQPEELLSGLQAIEKKLGRKPADKSCGFQARTIDLDILLFGSVSLQGPVLTLPHPAMQDRTFVLIPLLELAPDIIFPDGKKGRACLEKLNFNLKNNHIWQK